MFRSLIICLALAVPIPPGSVSYAAPPSTLTYAPPPRPADAVPLTIERFDSPAQVTERLSSDVVYVPGVATGEVLRRPSMQASGTDGRGGRKYLPVFLSALIPGAGELYMGHIKRGVALVAIEAGAWTGYFVNHEKGLDTRDEYEAFADEHWTIRKFIDDHIIIYPQEGITLEELEAEGRARSGNNIWPGYSPWVSKEEDKQHYYENIGKYDWYVSGWDDYVPLTTPDDLESGEVLSQRREEYRAMRRESNDQLDTATNFTYLSIATRVFSLVQTAILVTRSNDDDERADAGRGERLDNHWQVRARSTGRSSGYLALEYRFK